MSILRTHTQEFRCDISMVDKNEDKSNFSISNIILHFGITNKKGHCFFYNVFLDEVNKHLIYQKSVSDGYLALENSFEIDFLNLIIERENLRDTLNNYINEKLTEIGKKCKAGVQNSGQL